MRASVLVSALSLWIGLAGTAHATEQKLVITQLTAAGPDQGRPIFDTPSRMFMARTQAQCWDKQNEEIRFAPIVGAIVGVAINWMFDRSLSQLSK